MSISQLRAFNGEPSTSAHPSRATMDELHRDHPAYDLLLWRGDDVQVTRVQQPDRIQALALARRLNDGHPVALVAIEESQVQT